MAVFLTLDARRRRDSLCLIFVFRIFGGYKLFARGVIGAQESGFPHCTIFVDKSDCADCASFDFVPRFLNDGRFYIISLVGKHFEEMTLSAYQSDRLNFFGTAVDACEPLNAPPTNKIATPFNNDRIAAAVVADRHPNELATVSYKWPLDKGYADARTVRRDVISSGQLPQFVGGSLKSERECRDKDSRDSCQPTESMPDPKLWNAPITSEVDVRTKVTAQKAVATSAPIAISCPRTFLMRPSIAALKMLLSIPPIYRNSGRATWG
jgi:hypothetical protein